jgi:hypothetical protein
MSGLNETLATWWLRQSSRKAGCRETSGSVPSGLSAALGEALAFGRVGPRQSIQRALAAVFTCKEIAIGVNPTSEPWVRPKPMDKLSGMF